ncbi:hypothetical protein VQ03_10925 [Methylobacterium tarhaniae]|uniref:Uncharacterized protein n=1 Tax=Methylobacterium tarhaniae TaxID=1187852 RepID=A0A0J6T9Z6_9HYPH|nr:hypothetical protein VQ03_10925 [Methylobacterium tarhaniae]
MAVSGERWGGGVVPRRHGGPARRLSRAQEYPRHGEARGRIAPGGRFPARRMGLDVGHHGQGLPTAPALRRDRRSLRLTVSAHQDGETRRWRRTCRAGRSGIDRTATDRNSSASSRRREWSCRAVASA